MALGRRNSRVRAAPTPRLHITAMMDMFTIIMIFLLVSFSDRPQTVELDRDLELPKSAARMDYTDSINLVMTRDALKIEGEVVARWDGDRPVGLDPDRLQESELYRRLKTYREEADQAGKAGEETKPFVLFFCDRRLRFDAVNQVIKTAGLAGYPNLQFAVLQE